MIRAVIEWLTDYLAPKPPKANRIPVLDEFGNEEDDFLTDLINDAWNSNEPIVRERSNG